jgi:hypothetical protein
MPAPTPPGAEPATAAGASGRIFRRSLSARVISVIALLMFGSALAARTAAGDFGAGWFIVLGLTLVAFAGVVSAWGDRVTIGPHGVESRNLFLSVLAGGRPPFAGRALSWRDIVRVQEHRRPGSAPADPPRALFLVPVKGKRLALDSLEEFDEVVSLVRSGTSRTLSNPR